MAFAIFAKFLTVKPVNLTEFVQHVRQAALKMEMNVSRAM